MASRSYAPRHSAAPVRAQRTTTPVRAQRTTTPVRAQRTTTSRTAAALATTLGATAVVGAAIAAPAGAATTSHRTVWDRVASCESGGDWHIDTGNGFYGGLQFTSGTWGAYGGHKYANQADNANRDEQIEVARRVLKEQGRDAWPVCGPRAGLTRGNGHATGSPVPDRAVAFSASSSSPTNAHTSAKVTHSSHPTKLLHKSRSSAHTTYVVRSGDTLSSIAAKHHVAGGWRAIYRANRTHLSDPDVLRVGQRLLLP